MALPQQGPEDALIRIRAGLTGIALVHGVGVLVGASDDPAGLGRYGTDFWGRRWSRLRDAMRNRRSGPARRTTGSIAAVTEVLDRARRGTGGALVLWGEPGIGKTALLDHVTAASPDFAPLAVQPARCESGTPFAGAGHAAPAGRAPDRDSSGRPRPAALRGVLAGEVTGAGRSLTAVAVLSLLATLAVHRPLLIVVDDDTSARRGTAFVLGFVARPVDPHPVVVLDLAGHDAPVGGSWRGSIPLAVSPLAHDHAAQLVAAAHPGLDGPEVTRAVQAGGQPAGTARAACTNRRSCRRHGARAGPGCVRPSPSACRPCRPRHASSSVVLDGRGSCRR
ncbi:hypothetical protein SVIOM342S_04078 [Streptomyces violaceorubidus]